MKRVLFFLLLSVLSCAMTAQTGPSKKCPTCGLAIPKCPYKGKHPNPKCSTCGELLTLCQYKGNHPKCSTCGELLTLCQYNGNHPKPTTGTINGHGWVDLGLSVKWATCNVGANSPGDYGSYYAWGETRPKSRYDWDNCFDFDSSRDSWGVYKVYSLTRIIPSSGHDTARENWGGTWRMPTISELEELSSKCRWTWTSRDGHNGYVVTGPNGNSMFLPAAGYRIGTDSRFASERGGYWSSFLCVFNSYKACNLTFGSGFRVSINNNEGERRDGQSVRPVTD